MQNQAVINARSIQLRIERKPPVGPGLFVAIAAQTTHGDAGRAKTDLGQFHAGLKSVTIEVVDGVLYLRGPVRSYHMKQLAQESVRKFSDISTICNEVKVSADRD
jgi:hypothetical protein